MGEVRNEPAGPRGRLARVWRRLILPPFLCGRRAAPASAAHVAGRAPGEGQPAERQDREVARVAALHSMGLLDSAPEPRFDRIVESARTMLKTRFAAITMIDDERQLIKAAAGISRHEMPRDQSFCQFTILSVTPNIIPNARRDGRTQRLAPTVEAGITFYAGYPLRAPTGHLIGALCVFDTEPREASTVDTELLHDLAMMAERELWMAGSPPTRPAVRPTAT